MQQRNFLNLIFRGWSTEQPRICRSRQRQNYAWLGKTKRYRIHQANRIVDQVCQTNETRTVRFLRCYNSGHSATNIILILVFFHYL